MNKRKFGKKLLPVQLNDGTTILVDPASIRPEARTVHHGEYGSVKVNSPETFSIGNSVIIWPEAGKSVVVSMTKAALGVLATQFLETQKKIQ